MLTAYFDFARNLPGYDIVPFLMGAEYERIKRGEDSLAIEFLPGPNQGFRNDSIWPPDPADRRALRDKIMVPMLDMLPSCQTQTIWPDRSNVAWREPSIGRMQWTIGMERFFAAYAAGIRPLRNHYWVPLDYDKPIVTITLRESPHWPQRNSRVKEWVEAALALQQHYHVIIIRDTAKADEPFADAGCIPLFSNTDPMASHDMMHRAMLYNSSICNMFVSNGPAWFALAMDVPVIMFRPTCENAGSLASAAMMARAGLPTGAQIPGAPDYQRLEWKDDTADNILHALHEFARINF